MSPDIAANVRAILAELPAGVELVAAAKTRTAPEILEAVEAGVPIIGTSPNHCVPYSSSVDTLLAAGSSMVWISCSSLSDTIRCSETDCRLGR